MAKKQSCHILEKYAQQIAEMPTDELQKRWQNYENSESKRIRVKQMDSDGIFIFVPPERERKN